MVISQRNIWRIDRVIQFNEASLSNSSMNNLALANGGIIMKKQHSVANFAAPFLTMTECSRSMIDASKGPLIVVQRGRHSVSRAPSSSQKMTIIIFPADLSWRSRVGVCSSSIFQTLDTNWLRRS